MKEFIYFKTRFVPYENVRNRIIGLLLDVFKAILMYQAFASGEYVRAVL